MAGFTKNRCAIFDRIDELDGAKSVADLVKTLKPILSELAYFAVTGEGAVMEDREEWHTTYKEVLFAGHNADNADKRNSADTTSGRGKAVEGDTPRSKPKKRCKTGKSGKKGATGKTGKRDVAGSRLELTPALLSIMNGSHHSFSE